MHHSPGTAAFGILEDQIYDPTTHTDIQTAVKSDFYSGDWALRRWQTIIPAGLWYDDEYPGHWQSRVISGRDTEGSLHQQIFCSSRDKLENSAVFMENSAECDVLLPGIVEWGAPLEAKLPNLAQKGFKLKFPEQALSSIAANESGNIDEHHEEEHAEEFWPAEEDNDEDLDFDLKQDERMVFVVPRSPSKSPRKSPRKQEITAECPICQRKARLLDSEAGCCQSCLAHKCHTCQRPTAAEDQDEDGDCGVCKELGFYEIMYRLILRFAGDGNIAVRWEIAIPEMMEAAMNGEQLREDDVIVLLEDASVGMAA